MTITDTERPIRVLLTGAAGQLGMAIQRECAVSDIDLVALGSAELDITDEQEVLDAIQRHEPSHIINAAAYTKVDKAESEPEKAFAINHHGAACLAKAAAAGNVHLLHVSTDYVFDGKQSSPYLPGDAVNPINVYGSSKLAGERAVLEATHGQALIVRTAWLYSLRNHNFLTTMLRLMQEREELRVIDDQVGTPTNAERLARVLLKFAAGDLRGIYHWTDAGVASWYDFSVGIYEEAKACALINKEIKITPVPSDCFQSMAARPSFSVLNCKQSVSQLRVEAVHWRQALRSLLGASRASPDVEAVRDH